MPCWSSPTSPTASAGYWPRGWGSRRSCACTTSRVATTAPWPVPPHRPAPGRSGWRRCAIELDERLLERSRWLAGIADISAADAAVRARRARVPITNVPSFALGTRRGAPGPSRTPSGRPTVVFLGALDVATNHDAVSWFAEGSWPLVRAAVPDCRWHVVGRRPSSQVRTLVSRTPGAELHADVAEPAAFLAEADVSINPAVSGSGVNIKLVEYLAAGVPVVSTTRGSAGLGLTPGKDLLVADTPADFAARGGGPAHRPTERRRARAPPDRPPQVRYSTSGPA